MVRRFLHPIAAAAHITRKHLYSVLTKSGPFSDEDWVPGQETISALESSKILCVSTTVIMPSCSLTELQSHVSQGDSYSLKGSIDNNQALLTEELEV